MVMAADTAVTRCASIDDAASILTAGQTISVNKNADADAGQVYLLVKWL
jgi:hypothetical protein